MAAPLRPRYSAPVPEAMGRTDEGVDYATRPGEAVRAIGAGVIDFVGRFSGFGNYVRERLSGGQEVYYAEHAQTTVRVGQRVRQGQAVGRASSSLEVGLAQLGITPLPLAQAQGGYTEGQVTPAGLRFRSMLSGGATTAQTTLGQLWIDAGGAPKYANIMAAIALAESGGQVDATHQNSDGSIDRGLWQINSSHTQFSPARLVSDPAYNAQAAVRVFKGQGITAWTTYTSGAYRKYLQGASGHGVGSSAAPITRPGGGAADPGAAAGEAQDAAWYSFLNPDPTPYLKQWLPFNVFKDSANAVSDAGTFFKWVAWIFHPRNLLRGVEFLAGLGLFVMGIAISTKVFQQPDSSGERSSTGIVRQVAAQAPPVRAARGAQAARQGKRQARAARTRKQVQGRRSAARKAEATRLSNRDFERTAKNTPSEEIPF